MQKETGRPHQVKGNLHDRELRWSETLLTDDFTSLFLDSGCSHHIVRNIELLTDVVMNSNDDFLNIGIVNVDYGPNSMKRGYGTLWPLGRVLFVPDASHNSISCRQKTRHGLSINSLVDTATVAEWKKGNNNNNYNH